MSSNFCWKICWLFFIYYSFIILLSKPSQNISYKNAVNTQHVYRMCNCLNFVCQWTNLLVHQLYTYNSMYCTLSFIPILSSPHNTPHSSHPSTATPPLVISSMGWDCPFVAIFLFYATGCHHHAMIFPIIICQLAATGNTGYNTQYSVVP